MIGMKVEGLQTVQEKLKQLQSTAARRALRKGVAAGTKLLTKKAKANVHKGHGGVPGLLRKSMGSKVKTYRHSGASVGIIGPRKGFLHILAGGERVDPVKYGHIEENGRKIVIARKSRVLTDRRGSYFGRRVKAYRGRPFLKPTLEQSGGEAEVRVGIETMRQVVVELKKK